MLIETLFPPCDLDLCPQVGTLHHHIYPQQQVVLDCTAKYLAVLGGFGSGKTIAADVKGLLLSLTIPGNRGIIVRRTLTKLHDTTQRIFQECLERASINGIEYREKRDGFAHRIILPNGSEIFFRPSEDIGRFLGPEYGWFLVDEATEEPESTFQLLVGRLRLPAAGQYLCGMFLSNPPPKTHWIHKHFGEAFGIQIRGGSTYQLFRSSTRENPHLPQGYIDDLIQVYGPMEAQRVIEGQYGFASDGNPVYNPPFEHGRHVGDPKYLKHLPLVRAWDFGFRHPAVTFHQFGRCQHRTVHWIIHASLDELFELEAEHLAEKVKEYTRQIFPEAHPAMVVDCGDRAGANRNDRGPGPIIRLRPRPHNLQIKYKSCNLEPGIELINRRLRSTCTCGAPVVLIHRRATNVIDGFAGGYHFPRLRPGKAPGEKPAKDEFYDDIMDSIRYAAENYLRQALRDAGVGTLTVAQAVPPKQESWRWMIGENWFA